MGNCVTCMQCTRGHVGLLAPELKGFGEKGLCCGGPHAERFGLLDVLLHSPLGRWHRLVRGARFQRPTAFTACLVRECFLNV